MEQLRFFLEISETRIEDSIEVFVAGRRADLIDSASVCGDSFDAGLSAGGGGDINADGVRAGNPGSHTPANVWVHVALS